MCRTKRQSVKFGQVNNVKSVLTIFLLFFTTVVVDMIILQNSKTN